MSVIEGSDNTFEKEVLKSDKKVLVDFNAEWCGPCRMLKPFIEEISNEKEDIKVVSINVDESPDVSREYGIMSIPCLILFKDGKEVKRSVGFMPKDDLEDFINE